MDKPASSYVPPHRRLTLIPVIGIYIYCALYILATLNYPGGTYEDRTSKGFSWQHNYWCNLLSEQALNGAPNTARPIALTAMAVLSISLSVFWFVFPAYVSFRPLSRRIVQASGLLSMLLGCFIFTSYHDGVINAAGLFGLVALAGTLAGLWRLGWKGLFAWGLFLIVLIGLNNLFFYYMPLRQHLALLQKFTFLSFLGWICLICRSMKKYMCNQKVSYI